MNTLDAVNFESSRTEASFSRSSARLNDLHSSSTPCNLRGLWLPEETRASSAVAKNEVHHVHRRLKRGDNLYRVGAPFGSLYVVRTGFFKSFAIAENGDEQVTGFQMAGDVIGLDGIDSDSHTINVRALEDSVVCALPFNQLERVASRSPALQRQLHRLMSREIVHDQSVMMLLATMQAEARVAVFLLDLSRRFVARGCSGVEFVLRTTREEIGSYLGLRLETVSRVFSRLQQLELIAVDHKRVSLLDKSGLKALVGAEHPRRSGKPRLALVG